MKNSEKQIKVCGMREPANIADLVELPINYIGTILYPKSPRYSGEREDTAQAFRSLNSSVQKVGVLVHPTLSFIEEMQEKFAFDYLQLHSDESLDFCREAAKIAPIIKAFGIDTTTNFQTIESYSTIADFFIFDTATKAYGGSGKKFDWTLLDNYHGEKPYLLAGGLTVDDAQSLTTITDPRCMGFDINSGFEISPALKDISQIKEFVTTIHEQ